MRNFRSVGQQIEAGAEFVENINVPHRLNVLLSNATHIFNTYYRYFDAAINLFDFYVNVKTENARRRSQFEPIEDVVQQLDSIQQQLEDLQKSVSLLLIE